MNTFYFDEPGAFGSGSATPEAGEHITIPSNTTIKITRYNISRNSYSGLTIPSTSQLVLVEPNTKLYLNQSPTINGQLTSAANSEIIVSQITGKLEYSFWHNTSSWNGSNIPQSGDNITIPENTIMIVDNNSNISIKAYNTLTVPSSSIFFININYYTLYVQNFTLNGTLKLGEGSSVEIISDSDIYNDIINDDSHFQYYFDVSGAWNNNIVPAPGYNINLPLETTIIMTSSNISSNYYNELNIPETSKVITEGENINLYLSTDPNVAGELIFKNNSKIVVNDVSETNITTKYWNDQTIWQDNVVPIGGRNIVIPENMMVIIDSSEDIDGQVFETLTIPSTSILYVNVYNFTFKTYGLTIEGVLKLGRNSGFRKLHSDRPRDTYLLYPGYNTYYIDDIDAWDVSGIPQANGDFIVPDNTIIKITKRSIASEGYNRIYVPHSSKLIFVGTAILLMANTINILGEVKTTAGSRIFTNFANATTNIFTFWDDSASWTSGVPPKAGEHITIPENTHIVVTMDSSISVNGYKKLTIPASSSLTLDIEYFKLAIESMSIMGSLQLGPENRLIFNPYSPTVRAYTPLYLDVQGIKTSQSNSSSNIQSTYNFVMIANYTSARDFSKYIKYKMINNNAYFIYEPKRISTLTSSLRQDILNSSLTHVEGKFISNFSTSSTTLSNMFIQYVCDVLVNNPSSQSLLTNTVSIRNQINNSNLEQQIINILKQGITTMDFLDNNTYLKSLFSQIQNERPARIQKRKNGEVYNFPIYGGDDLSVFVRMSSNINVASGSEYLLLKSLYGTNSLLEFSDLSQSVKIKETIWRININLI
tara:strand:+ start:8830 stop:11292 length:2463 start_codon:yes stop_codon:yes gene_type:complete